MPVSPDPYEKLDRVTRAIERFSNNKLAMGAVMLLLGGIFLAIKVNTTGHE